MPERRIPKQIRLILGDPTPDSKEVDGKPFFKFATGFDDGPVYSAYTFGNLWNGWAVPYFDQDLVVKVVSDLNKGQAAGAVEGWDYVQWEWDGDKLYEVSVTHDRYGGPPEVLRNEVPTVSVDGKRYYNLGDGFTWNTFDDIIRLPQRDRKRIEVKQRLESIRNQLQMRTTRPFSQREDDLEYEQAELEEIAKQLGVE